MELDKATTMIIDEALDALGDTCMSAKNNDELPRDKTATPPSRESDDDDKDSDASDDSSNADGEDMGPASRKHNPRERASERARERERERESNRDRDTDKQASTSGDSGTSQQQQPKSTQLPPQQTGGAAAADAEFDEEEYLERLQRAKKLARSEITTRQWDRYNFCEIDLDQALGPVQDNCERISCHSVTAEQFRERFEVPCKPCVITGLLDNWPAYQKWSYQSLSERYGNVRLKCGEDDEGYKVKIRLDYFARYAATQKDDSPLYIFDADFGDEGKPTLPLLDEYSIPEYFKEDLFQYVGEDRRPPYKWMLIGPKRSGSSIHIDPLATSAWNSVISGLSLSPPHTHKHTHTHTIHIDPLARSAWSSVISGLIE